VERDGLREAENKCTEEAEQMKSCEDEEIGI
jgi:hypothetical protein